MVTLLNDEDPLLRVLFDRSLMCFQSVSLTTLFHNLIVKWSWFLAIILQVLKGNLGLGIHSHTLQCTEIWFLMSNSLRLMFNFISKLTTILHLSRHGSQQVPKTYQNLSSVAKFFLLNHCYPSSIEPDDLIPKLLGQYFVWPPVIYPKWVHHQVNQFKTQPWCQPHTQSLPTLPLCEQVHFAPAYFSHDLSSL